MNMDDKKPLVSVIVPVYNMESTISNCVQSLQNQDYCNFEIILVDDGSKDKSLEKCQALALKDERVRVFHMENKGSGPARNVGIQYARGKYAYFPDADDYLEPNAITILVDKMCRLKCDLIVFGFIWAQRNGHVLKRKIYEKSNQNGDRIRANYSDYLLMSSKWAIQGAPWNKFFDLDLIRENNLKYPSLRRHQDDCFIAMYMCHVKKVSFIDDVLYTYYVNSLTDEWRKYPVNYFKNICQLYGYRKKTILKWNKNDKKTFDLVEREFICNVIKSMELLFSPKHNFTFMQRLKQIKKYAEISGMNKIYVPNTIMKYQRIILCFLKMKLWMILYFALSFKVKMQKIIR